MATRIVGMLNARYGPPISLPVSVPYGHVNASALAGTIVGRHPGNHTGAEAHSSATSAMTAGSAAEDDVVIVGQAFCLSNNVNDVEAFWNALLAHRANFLTDLLPPPNDRWGIASFYAPLDYPASECTVDSTNFNAYGANQRGCFRHQPHGSVQYDASGACYA